MEVKTIGLDLGKDVFQVHGVTADVTVVFNRSIRRFLFWEARGSPLVRQTETHRDRIER